MTNPTPKVGKPLHGGTPKLTRTYSLSAEVVAKVDAIAARSDISASYLVEQCLRNWLELPADYASFDLHLISKNLFE